MTAPRPHEHINQIVFFFFNAETDWKTVPRLLPQQCLVLNLVNYKPEVIHRENTVQHCSSIHWLPFRWPTFWTLLILSVKSIQEKQFSMNGGHLNKSTLYSHTTKYILECVCEWVKKVFVILCKNFSLKMIDNLERDREFRHFS